MDKSGFDWTAILADAGISVPTQTVKVEVPSHAQGPSGAAKRKKGGTGDAKAAPAAAVAPGAPEGSHGLPGDGGADSDDAGPSGDDPGGSGPTEAKQGHGEPADVTSMMAFVEPVEPDDYIEPACFRFMFRIWDKLADPPPVVLATGPRGYGKTLAAIVYAARRKRKLLICNCNSEMTADSLLGTPRLDIKGRGGDWLQPGPIALAAREDAVLLMDEANALGTGTQLTLNPLCDAVQKGIFLPYTGERIEWPKPRIILAVNEGYAGTREIAPSLRDRCETMFAEPLPEPDEINLIVGRTGVAQEIAEKAVKCATAIRAAARGENSDSTPLDFDLSPRALFSFAQRVRAGQGEDDAWREAVIHRAGNSLRSAGTRAVLTELSKQIGGFNL